MGCVVYGAGNIPKKAQKLADQTPIRLAGYTKDREELATVYASADAMIHGSAAETYGLGVAEAICSGLPVAAPSAAAQRIGTRPRGCLYEPGSASGC